MGITNRRMRDIFKVLLNLGTSRNLKFSYAISRNLTILEKPVQVLEKKIEWPPSDPALKPPQIDEWDLRRNELIQEDCLRDDNSNPIIIDKKFQFRDTVAFEAKADRIKKKEFPAYAAAEEEFKAEAESLLDEPAGVEGFPYKIKWSFVRVDDNGDMVDMNGNQQAVLMSADMFDGEPPWLEDEEPPPLKAVPDAKTEEKAE